MRYPECSEQGRGYGRQDRGSATWANWLHSRRYRFWDLGWWRGERRTVWRSCLAGRPQPLVCSSQRARALVVELLLGWIGCRRSDRQNTETLSCLSARRRHLAQTQGDCNIVGGQTRIPSLLHCHCHHLMVLITHSTYFRLFVFNHVLCGSVFCCVLFCISIL